MVCSRCNADTDPGSETCFTCGKPLTAVIKRGTLVAGRYEVLSILGAGGMGTVYKARDRVQREDVAIKVLRPDLARRPEMERRFRSEMAVAQRVSHPNVCRILECGEHGGLLYVCMEFLEGTTSSACSADVTGSRPSRRSTSPYSSRSACRRSTTAASCTATSRRST